MGCILNEYLYYFYYREEAVQHILDAGITRGEVIRDVNIHMTEELSHMDVENDFENCLKVYDKWYGKREDAIWQMRPAYPEQKNPIILIFMQRMMELCRCCPEIYPFQIK